MADKLVEIINEKGFRHVDRKDIQPLRDIASGTFGSVCTAKDAYRQSVVAVKALHIPEKIEKRLFFYVNAVDSVS